MPAKKTRQPRPGSAGDHIATATIPYLERQATKIACENTADLILEYGSERAAALLAGYIRAYGHALIEFRGAHDALDIFEELIHKAERDIVAISPNIKTTILEAAARGGKTACSK